MNSQNFLSSPLEEERSFTSGTMEAVNEETKEMVSQLPDKVKAQILSLLSKGCSDCQVDSEEFSGRVSSSKSRSAERSQNRSPPQLSDVRLM